MTHLPGDSGHFRYLDTVRYSFHLITTALCHIPSACPHWERIHSVVVWLRLQYLCYIQASALIDLTGESVHEPNDAGASEFYEDLEPGPHLLRDWCDKEWERKILLLCLPLTHSKADQFAVLPTALAQSSLDAGFHLAHFRGSYDTEQAGLWDTLCKLSSKRQMSTVLWSCIQCSFTFPSVIPISHDTEIAVRM